MNEAIKLAIEKGGYEPQFPQVKYQRLHTDPLADKSVPINCMLEDPQFWQALGKALGWSIYIYKNGEMLPNTWLHYALQYHELNLTGGDPEKFWKELIK